MVTYLYECSDHGEFEKQLPLGSNKKPRCPVCKKGKTVRKKIGLVAIKFVGAGFTRSVSEQA